MTEPRDDARAFSEFGTSLLGALSDIHRVDEVQNLLIIRMGEKVIAMLVKMGMLDEAQELADQFGLAGQVLSAGAELTRERLAKSKEKGDE